MENKSESSGFELSSVADVVLRTGGQLLQNLIMNPDNGTISTDTTEAPSTHLKLLQSSSGSPADAEAIHDLPCFKDLIAVLVECFTIISLGYLSSRFKLISTDAKDLSAYLTTFALPMVIFLNIAQMEFQTINMSFLFCMLISKLLLFIIVTLITLAISYPTNFSFAGALSILATQSNDFALGYPLIKSLYGESRPEMLSYLNLMGPIQLLVINPLGIIMLEYGKSKSRKQQEQRQQHESAARRPSTGSIGRPTKECLHCSNQPAALPYGRPPTQTQSEQEIIKTDPQRRQAISNLASSVHAGSHAQFIEVAELAPSSEAHRISSSLINLSDRQENRASIVAEVDGEYTRSLSSNGQRTRDDDQLESALRPRRMSSSSGMKCNNIKSLTLVMPATSLPTHRMSNDSISSAASDLSEGEGSPSSDMKPSSAQQVQSGSFRSLNNSSAIESGVHTVYTRPKFFDMSVGFKWFARTDVSGNPNKARRQANVLPDDTQMRNVLADDLEPAANCNYCCQPGASSGAADSKIDLSFIGALLTNPLIIASIVALAVNLIHGPELPKIVTKCSNTIAASFAAPALFVVGLSMYGNFDLMLRNPNDFLLSSVLVLTKVLILPSIMRTVVILIVPHYLSAQEVPHLADFSYLYGLLPTAPGACIIAKQYEVLTNVVSICMLLSTLISAPLVLATSAVISQTATIKPIEAVDMIAQTLRASSSVTLVLSLLTLIMLWKSNRRISYLAFMNPIERIIETANKAKATHLFTFLLAMTQLVLSIGGIVWLFLDTSSIKLNPDHVKYPLTTGTTTATGGAEWNDYDELLAGDESRSLHSRFMKFGPHGFLVGRQMLSEDEHNEPAGNFRVMCTMQYVFSSGGLLMARFIILCIVLTNFAKCYGSQRFGQFVCSLVMKVYPLIGLAIILNLVFEAQHLSCLPGESSLPNWSISIYTRLLFNGTLLLCALPLFTGTFRLENKANWLKAQQEATSNLRDRRRFKQSSSSLTSDTSSAITTSTNLDTSINRQAPSSRRNSTTMRAPLEKQPSLVVAFADSDESALDCKAVGQSHSENGDARHQNLKPRQADKLGPPNRYDQDLNELKETHDLDESSLEERLQHTQTGVDISRNLYHHVNNLATSNSWHRQIKPCTAHIDNPNYAINALDSSLHNPTPVNPLDDRQNQDLIRANGTTKSKPIASTKTVTYENQPQVETSHTILMDEQQQHARWPCESSSATCCRCAGDFDKYSILIVFMLFQTFLNLTSMVQMLSQSSANGTFILIEMANVALDFGQGLITFLVICLQMTKTPTEMFCNRQSRGSNVRPIV